MTHSIDIAPHIDIVQHVEAEVFAAIDHANAKLTASGAPFRYVRRLEWEQLDPANEVSPYKFAPVNPNSHACVECGGCNMIQTGTCYTCADCGGAGGCG